MSIQLVIAEKPSVARSIAGVIGADQKRDGYMEGNGYLVSWCIGHLVSLADAGAYDERFKKWRYDDLPILPQEWQYIIPAEKKGQFAVLRSLMERPDVTGLVCATDAGREGELIFRFVYQMAGCKKPFKRLWISSMEDAAIREGFAHLKPGADYDNLYQSALCRAQADWLVGINATRLFSILYHKTLTVGRVQTPTLNMLVDREAKISNFKKEKYHVVHIAAGGMEAASDRFLNPDDADATKTACAGAQAVCVSVKREKKTEQPPRLYDLTSLQREANRLFGFTAKQTLDYAQQLYEKKLLTYPRTDSQYLTDDMLPTAESLVSGLWPLLSFAAILVFKLVFPESGVGWLNIWICGFLAAFAQLADIFMSWLGAKKFGATWRGGLGAFIGVFVGIFLPPPIFWIFVAPLAGAFLGEWLGGANIRESGKAGLGAFVGALVASMIKFLIVVYMAAAFTVEVFNLF